MGSLLFNNVGKWSLIDPQVIRSAGQDHPIDPSLELSILRIFIRTLDHDTNNQLDELPLFDPNLLHLLKILLLLIGDLSFQIRIYGELQASKNFPLPRDPWSPFLNYRECGGWDFRERILKCLSQNGIRHLKIFVKRPPGPAYPQPSTGTRDPLSFWIF